MRKTVKPDYNLEYCFPDIAQQWDSDKNIGKPAEITPYSGNYTWWKCEKGHSWEATILSRTQGGNGCPICAGRKLLSGYNDLETLFPNLAFEWDYTKNPFKPSEIRAFSHEKVWWICEKGHNYKATIDHRCSGSGCPICAGKIVVAGFNDLASNCPEILEEWDYNKNTIDPTEIAPYAHVNVWWKCSICGKSWKASLETKVRRHSIGCPTCNNQTSFPEQAVYFFTKKIFQEAVNRWKFPDSKYELDVYIPSILVGIEYDGMRFHKNKQNQDNITEQLCEKYGIKLIRISDSLDSNYIYKWNGYTDSMLSEIITTMFKKEFDIDYTCNVKDNIPQILALSKKTTMEKSLEYNFPEIAAEWNYERNGDLKSNMISAFSNAKVWWKCSLGHEWQTTVCHRTKDKSKCPYCANQKILSGFNDLAIRYPSLLTQWDYEQNTVSPNDISPGSHTTVLWKCQVCGCNWSAAPNDRIAGRYNCPKCKTKLNVVEKNTEKSKILFDF